jgi:hypothetical protein
LTAGHPISARIDSASVALSGVKPVSLNGREEACSGTRNCSVRTSGTKRATSRGTAAVCPCAWQRHLEHAAQAIVGRGEVRRAEQIVEADERAVDRRGDRFGRSHAFERRPRDEQARRQQRDDAPRAAVDDGPELRGVTGGLIGAGDRGEGNHGARAAAPFVERPEQLRERVQADVQHGIRLFECREIGHGRWSPDCLRRTDADVFAGWEDVHQVAASAEEGGQLRQHESGAAGQDEPQAAALAHRLVPCEIGGDPAVPEREQPLHHAAQEHRAQAAEGTERQGVVDAIDEHRAAIAGWLHLVRVFPLLERTGHLDVLELHAVHEPAMQRLPAKRQRPVPEHQRDAGAVGNTAMPREDAEVLPRRRQALEGAGPLCATGTGWPGRCR